MNQAFEEKKYTTTPIYIGSSVIGMKYRNGVVVATDTRLNYGSISKFFNVDDRIQRVNSNTLIASSGEYSDFQEVIRMLRELALEDKLDSKGFLGPNEIMNYLSTVHYAKRNKMNPFLNSTLIAGIGFDGKPTLSSIDQFGTLLTANYMPVGMAQYFCNSIIAPEYPANYEDFSRDQAIQLIQKCFEVLFYRDTRAGNNIKFGFLEKRDEGYEYHEAQIELKTQWNYERFRNQANERIYLTNY